MQQIINSKNLFLWSPILISFGAALYFLLPTEPCLVLPIVLALMCFAGAVIQKIPVLIRAILIFCIGVFYASAFTAFILTPQISRNMRDISIVGTIEDIDYTTDKVRLFLSVPASELGIDDESMAIIRLSMADSNNIPNIGDTIRANVGIFRPGPATAPGAFDFARWAYFNGITATGYLDSYITEINSPSENINFFRDLLHRTANSFLSDSLVLGYKHVVPSYDSKIWSNVGVGHIWSISGFHTTLVGGWLFAIFYFVCRCIPWLTRRFPARYTATIFAWLGLLIYVLFSGMAVSTLRAFFMTSLVFVAVLVGRNAISLRNVSIVYLMLFLLNPHHVMQAGFQLSFAAIYGLIWLWTVLNPQMPNNKILRPFYAAILTTVVATLFTAVFVSAHFYSFPLYGLLGNLILVPIFSFLIMPIVILGTILSVFGIYALLDVGVYLYDIALNIGKWITSLPFSSILMPDIPFWVMGMVIVGMGCVIFCNSRLKYLICLILICVAFCVTLLLPRPVFYTTYDHELIGLVYNEKLEFNKSRASNHFFAFDTWKRINREPVEAENIRRRGDKGLWLYNTGSFTIAYIQKFIPLSRNIVELCRDKNVKYIVSYFDIDAPKCNHKILQGGLVIYPNGHVSHVTHGRRWHSPQK